MCGLLGWYLKRLDRGIVPLATGLTCLMDSRGDDSWGFVAYSGCPERATFKKDVGSFAKEVPSRSLKRYTMLMGHTRAASVGPIRSDTAHPFRFGHITGAHNGAIHNYVPLNTKYGRKFEVDSMHIFAHLADDLPLDELRGWGSITWIDDRQPDRVYMCRFNGGPLEVASIKNADGSVLGTAWASTKDALELALGSAGYQKFTTYDMKENLVYYTAPDETGAPILYVDESRRHDVGPRYAYWDPKGTSTSGYGYATTPNDVYYCEVCEQWDTSVSFHPNSQGKHVPSQYYDASKHKAVPSEFTEHDVQVYEDLFQKAMDKKPIQTKMSDIVLTVHAGPSGNTHATDLSKGPCEQCVKEGDALAECSFCTDAPPGVVRKFFGWPACDECMRGLIELAGEIKDGPKIKDVTAALANAVQRPERSDN